MVDDQINNPDIEKIVPEFERQTIVRVPRVIVAGNQAPPYVKRAIIFLNNVTLSAPGTLFVTLGMNCAIPFYIPAGGLTTSIVIYDGGSGDEFMELGDFNTSVVPATGNVYLYYTH